MIPDYRKKEIKEMIILDGDQKSSQYHPRKILGYKEMLKNSTN